jgi:aromatic-amino-acid transaminase
MCTRIQAMRRAIHDGLQKRGIHHNISRFLTQRGMFTYTGLNADQADTLREKHGVYLLRSGRICVAGLNTGNVEAVAAAFAAVMNAKN